MPLRSGLFSISRQADLCLTVDAADSPGIIP